MNIATKKEFYDFKIQYYNSNENNVAEVALSFFFCPSHLKSIKTQVLTKFKRIPF